MGFFELAILEAALLGALSGIVGTIVVLRRRAFFTVALTHATFPGGVIAALLGLNILLGAAVFSIVLVGIMLVISRVDRQGSQVASGVVLTFGFALGALLQSLNRDMSVQVDTFLIGNILTVSPGDIAVTAGVLVLAVLCVLFAGKQLLFSSFDPQGYRLAGFRPVAIDLVVLGLIAATVVVSMPAVGSILAIALIAGPAVSARLIMRRIEWMIPLAVLFGLVSGVGGLWVSRVFSVAAGGGIALTACAIVMLAVAYDRVRQYRAERSANGGREA
ncbi:metal ABC transporter permease [Klugiella xanthotipulae]|uniref:ABC-type Mn2+/Zn2+ transport system permease subunit n=1 Tax=Klugiella xanthotipulae TaxID=244735 RepID=A0A543I6Q0_9MICO|nr:metal ABC transporter permease [Klugiella xanthotipulae]TQM66247.1 ABC-type Mn2+/Zn2+ transport system permease subunit [Klugiella xanthotipulae]